MDCSPSGFSVHGILQARILEWVAISFSRGIFPTHGSNPHLLHCRQILYQLSPQGSPICLPLSKLVFSFFNSIFPLYWFSSVQSLSHVRLFATPWTAACRASLSITNSRSSLKLTSIESVMSSSHLKLLSSPSPPAPNPSQHQSLFQWVNSLHMVAKVLEFQL